MTGLGWMTDYGETLSQTQLAIARPEHPLAGGLREIATITGAASKLVWGKPAASAIVAATIVGQPTQAAIYAYETGAQMKVGVAAGIRVGFFAGRDTASAFNGNGWALFDAAIAFATGRALPMAPCAGRPDGTSCSDGNVCNGAEVCSAGVCASAPTLECNDSNACTQDMCEPVAGCVYATKALGSSCADGNACNGAETCNASGVCNAGATLVCNDGNDCTTDSCNPATGCTTATVPQGQQCTTANTCSAGSCNAGGLCVTTGVQDPVCSVTQLQACVYQESNGYRAVFGYNSAATLNVFAAAGGNANRVSPGAPDRGQPSWFKPGSNPVAFVVTMTPGETIAWKLGNSAPVSVTATGANTCAVSSGPEGKVLAVAGKDYLLEPLLSSIASDKIIPPRVGSALEPLPGKVEVSQDGSATYSIPLWTPPGRNGMQPSLSLNYNSNGGNGLLGMGWSLSGDFSTIEYCRVSRRVSATHATRTSLCLDGAPLVRLNDGSYRTKVESFAKVVKVGNDFKVYQKGGRIATYSAYRDQWNLTRLEDRFGNAMIVTYDHTSAAWATVGTETVETRPLRIAYTFPLATRLVEFQYADRAQHDLIASSRVGVRLTTKKLTAILMKAPNPTVVGTVKRYEITYHANESSPTGDWSNMAGRTTITGRELLSSVKECDGNGVCRPATTMEYEPGTFGFTGLSTGPGGLEIENDPIPLGPNDVDPAVTTGMRKSPPVHTQWADINRDGLPEKIWAVVVSGPLANFKSRFIGGAMLVLKDTDEMAAARYYYRENKSHVGSDGVWRHVLGPQKVLVDRFFQYGVGTEAYPSYSVEPFFIVTRPRSMASRYPVPEPMVVDLDGKGSKEVYIPELTRGVEFLERSDGKLFMDFYWNHMVWTVGATGNTGLRQDLFPVRSVRYWNPGFYYPGDSCDNNQWTNRHYTCFPPPPRIFKEASSGDTNGDGVDELYVDTYGEGDDFSGLQDVYTPSNESGTYLWDVDGDGVFEKVDFPRAVFEGNVWVPSELPLQIDMNGDGLQESITAEEWSIPPPDVSKVMRSHPQFLTDPTDNTKGNSGDRGDRVLDVDLDGRDDLWAGGSRHTVYLQKEKLRHASEPGVGLLLRLAWGDPVTQPYSPMAQYRFVEQVVDFNGDGMADLAGDSWIDLRVSKRPDMLKRIHRGAGPATSATTIDYVPISGGDSGKTYNRGPCQNIEGSEILKRECMHVGMWVVSKVQSDAGLAPSDGQSMAVRRTLEYQYAGGYRDKDSGAFLGFESFTVVDKDRKVTTGGVEKYLTTETSYYQGSNGDPNTSDTLVYETPGFGFIMAGRPRETIARIPLANGTEHVTRTTYAYEYVTYYGGNTLDVRNTRIVETFDDATGACPGPERETYTSIEYSSDVMVGGLPKRKVATQRTGAGCASLVSTGARKAVDRITVETFDHFADATRWFVGLPNVIAKTQREGGAEVTQLQTNDFNPSTGAIDFQRIQPNVPTESKTIQYIRDSFGLVISQIETADPSFNLVPRVVTTTYDKRENIFPETVENALGHHVTTIVHPAFGAPVWTRDLNGNVTRSWYDTFFRPAWTVTPNGEVEGKKLVTMTDYRVGNPMNWAELAKITIVGTCTGDCPVRGVLSEIAVTTEQVDRMGRPIYITKRNTLGEAGYYKYTSTRKFYDIFGNVAREDIPFEEITAGSAGANVPMTSRGRLEYTYDRLDRVTGQITRAPDMSVVARSSTYYSDLSVVLTDATGQRRVTESDDLGRTVSASAVSNMNGFLGTMSYTYGPIGQLATTTDAKGNVSRMFYD
ncbi:MAG: SpvB/TcaC N-terminal domain-containing protein, partial [Deltaproteobacteria bacterium]|nr:SpvB/TcaC N-terminal domain-containing protein [Deltaproteobacteria bacterium]